MNHRCPVRALSRALSRALTTATTAAASQAPTPSTFPLKNVTRSNFEPALESLRDHVRAADFVAVDLEMTGVTSAPWRESFEFDRYDVRYLKVKDSAEKFAVVQFGVCPFRWDPQELCFVAYPHNFYIFPRQELSFDDPAAYEFHCQTASVDFLAKYQFDFNMCIREGISYLSREQENELLRHLEESSCSRLKHKEFRDVPLISMADVLFSERIKNRMKKWRDELLHDRNCEIQFSESSNDSKQQIQTIFYRARPALALSGFTAHQLRLIQQVTRNHFEDIVYVCANVQNSCLQLLLVYSDCNTDKDLLMKEVDDENCRGEELKIRSAVGFRHVIDLLSSEQKLIVGHNCFLDVAHIYRKFFGQLPFAAEEFVSSANKHLPYIIDTKVLLNSSDILKYWMRKSKTSLSSSFVRLCPQIALGYMSTDLASKTCVRVEVQVDDVRASSWDAGAKHEAGYDAFMTGCVFAQACSHLGIKFHPRSSSEILARDETLEKYVNRLFLSWNNQDIINLSTGSVTENSVGSTYCKNRYSRILFENIILIWGFPPKLKAREIKECISKVFGPTSVTSVYSLDKTTVFVQFKEPESVSDFLGLKETLERNDDAISILNPLWRLLEGGNTCAADYETYKEICSSPVSKVYFSDQARAVGIKWKTKLLNSEVPGEEGIQKQGDTNLSLESAAGDYVLDKTNVKSKKSASDDMNRRSFSCGEILDSLCAHEVERVRTY
ncbi:poly(A)-specific ribonuclease PARN isoform X1 [Syzygium oleosum]|uniref:poly(A)-specific ribonuclease PARN isoform X1 n=2 Tax=Syzygium oleosum TaxID=219896 RepID=UPI0011D1D7DA|nr:poly(A)-specific ribonuclease PARN isoform X1 [Syzygium oleosum]